MVGDKDDGENGDFYSGKGAVVRPMVSMAVVVMLEVVVIGDGTALEVEVGLVILIVL